MLTFNPYDLIVLQKLESSGLDGDLMLPGLCHVCLIKQLGL